MGRVFTNVELFSVQAYCTFSLQGTLNSVWRHFRWLQLVGWRGGTMLEACNVWSPGMLLHILNIEDSPSNRELLGLESLQFWGWQILTESRGYTCVIREIGYGRLLTEEETLEPDCEGFSKVFCFSLSVFYHHCSFAFSFPYHFFFVTSWSCINFYLLRCYLIQYFNNYFYFCTF